MNIVEVAEVLNKLKKYVYDDDGNVLLRAPDDGHIFRMPRGGDPGRYVRKGYTAVTRFDDDQQRDVGPFLEDGDWSGGRCVIVAGGPSLRGFDWTRLDGELTIAVNRAFEMIERPTVSCTLDDRWYNWITGGQYGEEARQKYHDYRGHRVCMKMNTTRVGRFDEDLVQTILPFPGGMNALSHKLEYGLGCGENSGFMALNLALLLGAKEIYLLGYDMETNGKLQTWWHDGHPDLDGGNSSKQPDDVYKKFRFAFDWNAKKINAMARVINCNAKSGIKCFEFGHLPRNKRPVVINYYTAGTSYEEMAAKMRASAERFGFRVDARPVENMGGWQKNTYYKARFCREMLDEYPRNQPLLWLDADLEVKRLPAIFDAPPWDFGVNIVNWMDYPETRGSRDHKELNTSVMYMRNNQRVRDLLDAWIARNEHRAAHNSPVWEQENLQETLESGHCPKRLKFHKLPDSHCQIHDSMAAAGDPVIELRQASRHTKKEVGA